jgi:hypothetical protein
MSESIGKAGSRQREGQPQWAPDKFFTDSCAANPGSTGSAPLTVFPVRSRLQDAFAPKAAVVLALLLVFALVGASHELRTPLAITQALLEVARSDPHHDREKLDERLRAVNTRAIDLTEALLLLSRADQQAFTREDVDLSLLVSAARAGTGAGHADRGRPRATAPDPPVVRAARCRRRGTAPALSRASSRRGLRPRPADHRADRARGAGPGRSPHGVNRGERLLSHLLAHLCELGFPADRLFNAEGGVS